MKKIFVSEPFLDSDDKKAILNSIETGYVSSIGRNINIFEKEIIKFTKSKFCVVCANGTSALQIALKVIGVQKDDEVIAPTMTFAATINSILYNDANPIFMDCDENLNLDIKKTLEFLDKNTLTFKKKTFNKKTKKKIAAIVVAHMYGKLCDLDELKKICKLKNIKIIEDAAESIGSFYKKNKIHSGNIGDIGCFSFNGNKIITSGSGGAIISKNKRYIEKARYLINQAKSFGDDYIHNEIGYNFRLSNLHASLGVSQIKKLKKYLRIKKTIYNYYCKKLLLNKNFEILKNNQLYISNNWINILKVKQKNNRLRLIKYLKKNNIEPRPIWYPMNKQKYCKKYQAYKIKNAPLMYKRCLCLPSSVNLNKKDLIRITNLLNRYEN